jgi:phosphate transport system substrate-binding protein
MKKRGLQMLSPTIIVLWLLALVFLVRSVTFFSCIAGSVGHDTMPSMMVCGAGKGGGPHVTAHGPRTVLQIAGTGSSIPIVGLMAQQYMQIHPDRRVIVHDSIGSTGGIKAVRAGDIDIGLVSRPLKPEEKGEMQIFPLAETAVVVAVNAGMPESSISAADLKALYLGKKRAWKNGLPVVVIQREQGDSSHQAVNRLIEGFEKINLEARKREKWRVVFKDHLMIKALAGTAGAVGLTDAGQVHLSHSSLVKILDFEHVPPAVENLASGAYPLSKTLAFVVRSGESSALAMDFIHFTQGPAERAVLIEAGYLPAGEEWKAGEADTPPGK